MANFCYFNGQIIKEDEVGLSLRDIGVLRGFGVFDFLRTYNGKPFLLDLHLKRFERSAAVLGLVIPISKEKITQILTVLLQKNNLKEANFRLVLTGGKSIDGMHFDKTTPTFYVLAEELHRLPENLYQDGVCLKSYEYARDLYGAKTINYSVAVKLLNNLEDKNVFEILYVQDKVILEAASSNFFIIKNNVLITPKNHILIGTTRDFVINLAKKNFKIEERILKQEELEEVDEAFITATNKEILPVVKIDGQIIGSGKVGKNTKALISIFHSFTENF